MADRLTSREIRLYKVLHGLGLVWGMGGFYLVFIGHLVEPTYLLASIYWTGCMPVVIFGLAFKTNTRVIYGIKWLRAKSGNGVKQ